MEKEFENKKLFGELTKSTPEQIEKSKKLEKQMGDLMDIESRIDGLEMAIHDDEGGYITSGTLQTVKSDGCQICINLITKTNEGDRLITIDTTN